MAQPTFYYDFNSPYAYLAAHRVDDVLPVRPRWEPIAFGALIRQIGKVPWSLQPGPERDRRRRECEQRTAALGLPLRWPAGWPEVKQRLRAATDAAIARGVTGVPTVAVGDELYWGDDRLEDAAAALSG